jgi:hypothetical protein
VSVAADAAIVMETDKVAAVHKVRIRCFVIGMSLRISQNVANFRRRLCDASSGDVVVCGEFELMGFSGFCMR